MHDVCVYLAPSPSSVRIHKTQSRRGTYGAGTNLLNLVSNQVIDSRITLGPSLLQLQHHAEYSYHRMPALKRDATHIFGCLVHSFRSR